MSMNIDIFNIKGEKVGDYTLDDSCLEFDKGTQAVHDTVVGYLAELRSGTILPNSVPELLRPKPEPRFPAAGRSPSNRKASDAPVPAVPAIRSGDTAVSLSVPNPAASRSNSTRKSNSLR